MKKELEKLYLWVLDRNRKPCQTHFSEGMIRNIAREVENAIHFSNAKNLEK